MSQLVGVVDDDRQVVELVTRFVDFSEDLVWVMTKVGLGELGKFRDGKRQRIKDVDAHGGTGRSVSRVSGTQYYRVKTRTKLDLDIVVSGKQKPAKLNLSCVVQLAKLPTGKIRRQVLSRDLGQTDLVPGMYGMWILEVDPKRQKNHSVTHVIPQPRGMKRPLFIKNARDMFDINRRLWELKSALEDARRRKLRGVTAEVLRKALDAVLAAKKLSLRNSENDRWVSQRPGTLEAAASRIRIAPSPASPRSPGAGPRAWRLRVSRTKRIAFAHRSALPSTGIRDHHRRRPRISTRASTSCDHRLR